MSHESIGAAPRQFIDCGNVSVNMVCILTIVCFACMLDVLDMQQCVCSLNILPVQLLRRCCHVQASTAKKKKELRPSDARRLAAKMGRSTEWMLFALHVVNLLLTLLVPSAVVELTHAEPVPGFFVVVCTVILWMKLVSYAHCNYDLRW